MFKGSGDNVCTAAHNCLKRTGAALEVNNLDIQTFVFEVAELFSEERGR